MTRALLALVIALALAGCGGKTHAQAPPTPTPLAALHATDQACVAGGCVALAHTPPGDHSGRQLIALAAPLIPRLFARPEYPGGFARVILPDSDWSLTCPERSAHAVAWATASASEVLAACRLGTGHPSNG